MMWMVAEFMFHHCRGMYARATFSDTPCSRNACATAPATLCAIGCKSWTGLCTGVFAGMCVGLCGVFAGMFTEMVAAGVAMSSAGSMCVCPRLCPSVPGWVVEDHAGAVCPLALSELASCRRSRCGCRSPRCPMRVCPLSACWPGGYVSCSGCAGCSLPVNACEPEHVQQTVSSTTVTHVQGCPASRSNVRTTAGGTVSRSPC